MTETSKDIHLYGCPRRAQRYQKKIKDSSEILTANKKDILSFVDHRSSEALNGKAVSAARAVKYIYCLRLIAQDMKADIC